MGIDAKFCYGFNRMRKKYPFFFKSQVRFKKIGNKFIYTNMGTRDLVMHKK